MAESTPGPWRWDRVKPGCECPDGIKDDGALTLLGAAGKTVLTGMGGQGAGGGWWDVDVNDADARLIAACPAMYDFIARKAKEGDTDATKILATISDN